MNDRIEDLIALAALGELTASESRELDDAAVADPVVANELAAALTAAAALQSAGAEEPPARLKPALMDAIAGIPQQAPVDPSSPGPQLRPIGSTRSGPRIGPWMVATAAAIAVLIGAAVVLSNGDDRTAGDEIAAVVDADDAVARSVAGEIGELQVVFSAEQDALVLTGDGIRTLPDDTTYQVWLVADGPPTSVGVAAPDDDGALELRVDGIDPTGAVVAITVEPSGGSEQPTTPIVAQTV